jgi:hypothetical protein
LPQLSLYLTDDLMDRLRLQADEAGLSLSAFVAEMLAAELDDTWPDEVRALAGAWPDFPTRDDLPPLPDDPRREPLP